MSCSTKMSDFTNNSDQIVKSIHVLEIAKSLRPTRSGHFQKRVQFDSTSMSHFQISNKTIYVFMNLMELRETIFP